MGKAERIVKFLERMYGPIRHHYSNPFRVLISCMLSQRTREENTEKASRNLFAVADNPLKILGLGRERLERLIRPAGAYRQKAKNIQGACMQLLEQHGGRVPEDRAELMRLPGVGWKTSAIVMSYGSGIPIIAVDTHVNRISKRLGIADKGDGVEQVREKLQDFFPKRKWLVINLGMVRFGRDICNPRVPKCSKCDLRAVCKYYQKGGRHR